MTIKVKNTQRVVMYTGELSCPVNDRKNAVTAIDTVLKSVKTREISIPQEQVIALQNVQECLLALKPVDTEKK
jgi:hypothetical protein